MAVPGSLQVMIMMMIVMIIMTQFFRIMGMGMLNYPWLLEGYEKPVRWQSK